MTSGLKNSCSHRADQKPLRAPGQVILVLLASCLITWSAGCSHKRNAKVEFNGVDCGPCQSMLQQIEYPDLICEDSGGMEFLGARPMTITNFQETESWDLTIEECVEIALANSKVLQKLGGVVVNAPGAASTLYDQALVETSQGGVEAALSDFDAQISNSLFINHNENFFNNPNFPFDNIVQDTTNYNFELAKQTATGASFAFRSLTDYSRVSAGFGSNGYNHVNQLEFRQPLMRGKGTLINRIAGPNAVPGVYNGVLIARIRSDISLADFEAAVRDLVFDVENNYWELYFAYRDLDTKIEARESARETWENRKLRYENGLSRPDDEAQARQQYFNFEFQAQDALAGKLNGQLGVLGAERNLRRLMGIPAGDGRVLRPSSEPSVAPVVFDWDRSQEQALGRRVEIRRQKWSVRQRELELIAAKALNKWRFDMIGQYGFRGFGENLFGTSPAPAGGAFNNMYKGNLDDWQLGFEFGGAIGNRQGHLAIRNAELSLVRERSILKEQQRQILHDLNAAYIEVDRAMANLRTSLNARIAANEELVPKQKRVKEGQENVFFLLDAEQRVANTESAVHRSVADYNRALLNYAYTAGTLLARNNIYLTEGAWTADAENNAIRKASRFPRVGPNDREVDTSPVSMGAYDQNAPTLARNVGEDGQVFPMFNTPAPNRLGAEPAPAELPSDRLPRSETEERTPDQIGNPVEQQKSPSDPDFSDLRFDFSKPSSIAQKYLRNRAAKR